MIMGALLTDQKGCFATKLILLMFLALGVALNIRLVSVRMDRSVENVVHH